VHLCVQVRALQACYFILGMGLLAACCSIWQCMDYMKALYGVSVASGDIGHTSRLSSARACVCVCV
jgi:hypothetical protein